MGWVPASLLEEGRVKVVSVLQADWDAGDEHSGQSERLGKGMVGRLEEPALRELKAACM